MENEIQEDRELRPIQGGEVPLSPEYAPPSEDDREEGIPLLYYWQVLLKRKWQVLSIIVLVIIFNVIIIIIILVIIIEIRVCINKSRLLSCMMPSIDVDSWFR